MNYGHASDEPPASWMDVLADPLTARLAGVLRTVGAGTRLPSERALAQSLGVSRTALRDRLRFLESAGILRRRSGSGTYAQPLDPDALTRTLGVAVMFSDLPAASFLPILTALDRQCARLAAVRADRALVVALVRTLHRMRTAVRPEQALGAHQGFHQLLADAVDNPAVLFLRTGILGTLRQAGLLWPDRPDPEPLDCLPHGDDPADIYRRHRRIARAVADRDPVGAASSFD